MLVDRKFLYFNIISSSSSVWVSILILFIDSKMRSKCYALFFPLCQGIGYDILVEMLRHISPTHVVKMRVSVESKNLPSGAFWFDDSQKGHVSLIEISATFRDSLKRS